MALKKLAKGSFESSITSYVPVESWFAICYFGVLGVFGLVANLVVIVVFMGTLRRKMNPSFGYILNMAAADIFMLLHLECVLSFTQKCGLLEFWLG
ncbi:Oidioi.mRNA.OKI2018_I69.XSR.g16864.t1.cds [Oikopleura dioica]|uniref:Oidioi.mRNA.OKI2018_I69.XSR.g16864.t1.cds n=1 Tax=Oikopleura dioica TaxID=34765 RepID=A0ABN7SLC7_OIKDI|nr:Oidioi.mRNA.OKI2018_I69.XSR.g16864.t1.cds [Oikopleura dioica]